MSKDKSKKNLRDARIEKDKPWTLNKDVVTKFTERWLFARDDNAQKSHKKMQEKNTPSCQNIQSKTSSNKR